MSANKYSVSANHEIKSVFHHMHLNQINYYIKLKLSPMGELKIEPPKGEMLNDYDKYKFQNLSLKNTECCLIAYAGRNNYNTYVTAIIVFIPEKAYVKDAKFITNRAKNVQYMLQASHKIECNNVYRIGHINEYEPIMDTTPLTPSNMPIAIPSPNRENWKSPQPNTFLSPYSQPTNSSNAPENIVLNSPSLVNQEASMPSNNPNEVNGEMFDELGPNNEATPHDSQMEPPKKNREEKKEREKKDVDYYFSHEQVTEMLDDMLVDMCKLDKLK